MKSRLLGLVMSRPTRTPIDLNLEVFETRVIGKHKTPIARASGKFMVAMAERNIPSVIWENECVNAESVGVR